LPAFIPGRVERRALDMLRPRAPANDVQSAKQLYGGQVRKNPLVLLVVGVILLIAGAMLTFGGTAPAADAATVAKCQERMKDQGAEMLGRCKESAFATAMTATDANAAARAISASNNSEIGGNALGMFLLGLGLVLTVAGGLAWRRRAATA